MNSFFLTAGAKKGTSFADKMPNGSRTPGTRLPLLLIHLMKMLELPWNPTESVSWNFLRGSGWEIQLSAPWHRHRQGQLPARDLPTRVAVAAAVVVRRKDLASGRRVFKKRPGGGCGILVKRFDKSMMSARAWELRWIHVSPKMSPGWFASMKASSDACPRTNAWCTSTGHPGIL